MVDIMIVEVPGSSIRKVVVDTVTGEVVVDMATGEVEVAMAMGEVVVAMVTAEAEILLEGKTLGLEGVDRGRGGRSVWRSRGS